MRGPLHPSLYQLDTRLWQINTRVWQTGPAGQRISRRDPARRREFQETLPDLREEDLAGSGFAISDCSVQDRLGGDAALA